MQTLAHRFRRFTFRRQLVIVAAVGIVFVTLSTALITAWQGSRQIRATQVEQGLRLAQSIAAQSRLALVFGAKENMQEAEGAALAFPDVIGLEVWQSDGRLLLRSGSGAGVPAGLPGDVAEPVLEGETAAAWTFVAPVKTANVSDSPFEASEHAPTKLGLVRLTVSKATLARLKTELFAANLAVGLLCALAVLFVLQILAKRLTRPLADLSVTMGEAELGKTGLRARLEGSSDLYHMAHAFNSMMEALEERENELRKARDSALRFAQLKADFAATVSHEIRTPLNGVIGTLDMLRSGSLRARKQELLDLAWDSSQYLLALVNNILDFSKLEAGKVEPEKALFDLRSLVRETVQLFASTAEMQHIGLTVTVEDRVPPMVTGDPARIRQILTNLVSNALKFTSAGSVRVAVLPEEDSRIRFVVSDTGLGIAKDDQDRVFDSFTQADTSTTRRFGGSGLGLAICKQLVKVLGGEIGVASIPGHGSQFWFSIPCPAAESYATEPKADDRTAPPETPSTRGAPFVLVVEDNRTNQMVAEGMLQVLGCRCEIADNGRKGLDAWRGGAWDLILMDCNMPEMDGFQATACIRNEERPGKRIAIIAMTANLQDSDLEKCLVAGMDDHVAKPLTIESLGRILERWLDWRAPSAREGESAPARAPDKGTPPLDMSAFDRLRDALGPALAEAIRPFVEDMPTYVARMERAISVGDVRVLRQTAHAIKGAASNLGAVHLAAVAREIEIHAESGALAELDSLMISLRTEYALVEPVLSAELEVTPDPEVPLGDKDAPRVLIVDDDRSTRSALRHALRRGGFLVDEASDGIDALIKLETRLPDAILMDALMPEMDGFDTCAELKRHSLWKDIPVLMITALEDRHSIERAFEAGASDFIPKPIHLSVVHRRVRRVIDANRAELQVRHLAYNDPLTSLPNRRLFLENAERAIAAADAHQSRLAILFLDLDRFKLINDSLGHELGDQLLSIVAQRIKACVRAEDCVARLGGDEFAVVICSLPAPDVAFNVARSISRALSSAVELDGQEVIATASIGISLYPQDGPDITTLLRHADTAMNRAKRDGCGIALYEATMETTMADRLRLENALRRALERDEIAVFYQPVIDSSDNSISGVEALVRWHHPEHGIVPPSDFIALAEDTGLILPVGERVLRLACAQARAWLDEGCRVRMAINISGKQLQQANLPEVITAVLTETSLPAELLVLEITESVLMERANEPVAMLQRLRDLGVGVAIDDFGTGYSSLSYLKRFPLDYLKIDRTFVQDLPADSDAAAITKGIVALAHSLRLKVVAEGVETAEQCALLSEIGCDQQQGYYHARPLPAEVAGARLRKQTGKQSRNSAHKLGKA